MGKKVKQLIKLKTKKSKFNLDTKINKLVKFVKAVIENKRKTVKL